MKPQLCQKVIKNFHKRGTMCQEKFLWIDAITDTSVNNEIIFETNNIMFCWLLNKDTQSEKPIESLKIICVKILKHRNTENSIKSIFRN